MAKIIEHEAPGGKRTKLEEVLPLKTPYIIQIFPVYACNFKCSYCVMSVKKSKRNFISDKINLNFKLYKKFIDDLKEFPDKIKVIRFVGIGEPLIHKDIVNMIKYTKESNVTEKIELLTNGSLLTKKMSHDLIDSGLDRLVISIQGITANEYKETSNIDIDFVSFIYNISYFYIQSRDKVDMYIKIVDTALKNDKEKEYFYMLFNDMCDSMAIETTVPLHKGIEKLEGMERETTQFGLPVKNINICPQSFIHMQLNPDGNIVPCYSWDYPVICGNIENDSAKNIWEGDEFNNFRVSMLENGMKSNKICSNCEMFKYRAFPEDVIEDTNTIEKLIKYYKKS